MFLAACSLASFVGQSIGSVIGATMNVQNGVFLALVISAIFLLCSGFFAPFDAIPIYLRWITYLSSARYGFEGTALATYSFDRVRFQCNQIYCHFRYPNAVLKELNMTDASYAFNIIVLVIMFVVFRIFGYISLFLRLRLSKSRS